MGCSNGNDYININQNILIRLFLNLYKNQIIINNSIQESLIGEFKYKYKPKLYYLVNRFWKEDYLKFFSYDEFKSIIFELIRKKYYDVNVDQINAFSKGENFESLLKDERIQELIETIKKKSNINLRLIKAVSHIKNDFIKLDQEKVQFPANNTSLLDKETFDLMIRLLDDTNEDKKIKKSELSEIFCSQALLGNENIYIKIKDNEIIICFLENEKLRTKYFINFKNENNFEEIIKKYILDKSLEMHIEYNYDMSSICEHQVSDEYNNNIGFVLNLIPIDNNDEINKKIENQGAPPITCYNNKNIGINNINMEETKKKSEDVREYKNINNLDDSINNDKEKSLIEKNSENDLISKKDDNISDNDINNDNIFNNNKTLIGNNEAKKNNIDNNNINLITNEDNDKSYITDNGKNDNKILIEDDNIVNSNNKIFRRIKKMESSDIINEILQCLINIEIIRDFFIGHKKEIIDENKKNPIFCKRFFNTIRYVNNYVLSNDEKIFDDDFLNKNILNSKFDIISFLSFLFNKFKDELKDLSLNINEKCIDKFFYGQRNIEYTCQKCEAEFFNSQPFFYLKFDLAKIFTYCIKQNDYIQNIDLTDCFNYNYKFSEEFEFVCDKCKSKNYKIKSYEISRLPDIIIVILENGFQTPFINKFLLKSTALVNDKEETYYSLVSQIGKNERETLVTHLQSLEDLKWRECLENDIVECSEDDVKNKVPCVLFYQKTQDLNKIKLIDEDDNSVILHENDNIDLVFYSTVTRIKEKLEHLDSNHTIEYIYNEILCKKYKFENENKKFFFCNSRKLDESKSIKDNNLNNDDFVIIVEYNYS